MSDLNSPLLIIMARRRWNGLVTQTEKMLASSALRSLFSGTIRVLGQSDCQLFKIQRSRLEEFQVKYPADNNHSSQGAPDPRPFIDYILSNMKHGSRKWVILANDAGLVLRNVDHLFPRRVFDLELDHEVDLYWTEADGADGNGGEQTASHGLSAVRAEYLPLLLQKWKDVWMEESSSKDQDQIWTRVLKLIELRTRCFERGEVYAPRIENIDWRRLNDSAFVTIPNWPEREQWNFLQSLYFGTYFGDDTGLMLNILDP